MAEAVTLTLRAIETGVRPVRMRLPFRFGASTLNACPQLFVRVDADVGGRRATGWAAELMVPKWFDKRAGFTPATNVEHLARSVELARSAYLADAPATPFDLFCRHYPAITQSANTEGLTDLSAAYGQAVIDRAVLDAVCNALKISFYSAARKNLLGLGDTPLADDMRGWGWDGWLAKLQPLPRIDIRHTVGLLDEIEAVHYADDGLPTSLPAVVERYGHRYFKIKLGGNPKQDLERLRAVLETLRRQVQELRYTLDANEQYANTDALRALFDGMGDLPQPLYLEQPLPRDASLTPELKSLQAPVPLLMDEADGTLDAFERARGFGWRGVSSKGCKGLYKALINRARCERWNGEQDAVRYFMSAEDLTCQAGISVQQDLALAALLGLTHSERNGHHYGTGLASAPESEREVFQSAHPDLYDETGRLHIVAGAVRLESLFNAGFAHGADPDVAALQPLATAAAML